MAGISLDTLRQYQWGRNWEWSVSFPQGGPPPFGTDFFPATGCDITLATLDMYQFEGGLGKFELPQDSDVRSIKIDFADTVWLSVTAWVDNWINIEILHNDQVNRGIATIHEAVKLIKIERYTNKGEIAFMGAYWVFPKSAFSWEGGNESEPVKGNIEFVIAGDFVDPKQMYRHPERGKTSPGTSVRVSLPTAIIG